MGIKGIYQEIGPGRRVALSRLAVEHYEKHGRPLRLAIDISIWLFQIQSSKGGTNPALRTFYYRLLRLISLSIHPLFVFDGPNKPPFKRNKRIGPNVASIPEFLAKQLLKQFGLPFHLAPGEAEAECAVLQQKGVVDAVLSEDVDTLMFGSGLTFRSWSPEPTVKTKSPTHVNIYDAKETKETAGLDRQGMILVAMMSGGDYIPEGVPGIGQKTACEAARARFGEDLCRIKKGDKKAIAEWKERLVHELKTNKSKYFKQKHKTLEIPEDFPRTDVLGYYTNPVVSSGDKVEQLKTTVLWDQEFDISGLRTFCAEAFDWVCISGAKHFIRNLSRALLVRSLRMRADEPSSDDTYEVATREALLVKTIHARRQHPSTDNIDELRIGFRPLDIVPIDLDAEEPDPEQAIEGVESDEEGANELEDAAEPGEEPASPRKKRKTTAYDPASIVKEWVFETYIKVGVPLKVQDWEESFRNAKKYELMKNQRRRVEKEAKGKKTRGGMERGALDGFTRVTKPGIRSTKSPTPVSLTQPLSAPKVDEMEPVPLTQPNRCFRPQGNAQASSLSQNLKSSFRAPPIIPSSSPAPEETIHPPATIDLLSSPPQRSVVPSKRPLRRATSDPFKLVDDKDVKPSSQLANAISDRTLPAGVSPKSQSRRSNFRRTHTLPEPPSSAPYELAQSLPSQRGSFGEATSPSSRASGTTSQSKQAFKKPKELPPASEKPSPNATPRGAKRTQKRAAASPSKAIEITSSPATSATKIKQQSITNFFNSSPPASPSPVRTRRKRELSPFYANSGRDYDYANLPKMSPLRPAVASGVDVADEKLRGDDDGFLGGENDVADRKPCRSPRLGKISDITRRKPLTETAANRIRSSAAWKIHEERKRTVRLRDSLQGAFALDNIAEGESPKPIAGSTRKGKRWRVSELELLDLTA